MRYVTAAPQTATYDVESHIVLNGSRDSTRAFSNKSMAQEGGIFLQPSLPKEPLIKNNPEDMYLLNQDSRDVNPSSSRAEPFIPTKNSLA